MNATNAITRFEDIQAWQESRVLVRLVYEAISNNDRFRKDFRLVSQIQAAAVSVMSNIAEGYSRKGNKEFIQFLFISKSSAAEVQSQLYVALDQNYIDEETFQKIYDKADKVARMTSNFIKYMNANASK